MSDRTKYRKNRNNWQRVYPRRRRKPVSTSYIDDETGTTTTIDLNRTLRFRSIYQLNDPISGSAIPGPVDPFPPWVNCPGAFMYNALASVGDVVEEGSGVDTWNEFSGGLAFRQTTDADRPQWDKSNWVNFDNQYHMQLSGGINQWDFLKETGGTVIALMRFTGAIGFGSNGYVYGSRAGIFTRGTEMRVFSSAPGLMSFSVTIGTSGFALEEFGPTFIDTTSGSNYLVIGRFISGTLPGVSKSDAPECRVNGQYADPRPSWTNWNSTNSSITPELGKLPGGFVNFQGELAIFVACPTVLTDQQCADIEAWAEANYDVQLSSSINGTGPAPGEVS